MQDRDGEVEFEELRKVVDELNAQTLLDKGGAYSGNPPLDARSIWALLDQDRSGAISVNEFAESARAAAAISPPPVPARKA